MFWQTSRRRLNYSNKTLVMGIMNTTPDSFSDGGMFSSIEDALKRAEKLIEEGADILDIGGESTRPQSRRVSVEEEINRVIPVIGAIVRRFDFPVSIDTTKSEVAEKAIEAGAEIVNDISGLRFDEEIGEIAAKYRIGLVLMHSRGDFATMHKQKPVGDILPEVSESFRQSIAKAESFGVEKTQIALDVGIGFSKTFEQNLELIAELKTVCREFSDFPVLVGTSRKSFIGKILSDAPTFERVYGSLASAVVSVWNGAAIVRVHNVKETVEAIKIVDAIKNSHNDLEN